jgi:hypothetical protein
VAKLPNAANVAICRLPMTWSQSANRPEATTVVRTARTAACRDQTGTRLRSAPERRASHGAVAASAEALNRCRVYIRPDGPRAARRSPVRKLAVMWGAVFEDRRVAGTRAAGGILFGGASCHSSAPAVQEEGTLAMAIAARIEPLLMRAARASRRHGDPPA